MAGLADAARSVRDLAASRPPTLGSGRLVCVDGPSGSGKTTLARALAHDGGVVVHMDDLYEGWSGLPTVDEQLEGLLRPLQQGRPGSYRRWDWEADARAECVHVSPTPLLVVEGVGSGARAVADLVTVLVWMDAPTAVRRRRGTRRDGEAFARRWDAWARAEAERFAADGSRDRADVRLEPPTGRP